jgi:hypothetical protein
VDNLLKEAQERHRDSLDALSAQRRQIEEDLAFSDPSDPQQWDPTEKRQRENDPGGMRPCLVMDQIGQYVSNVAGQVEQRPPSLHAIPVGDGADRKVAEQLDGFFRQIEHASRAQQHYARALTSAARAGVGYLIVRPEFTDRPLKYKEPRISSEGDPMRVILDPWSQELDGSDANFGQLLSPLSNSEFERRFGVNAKKVSFGEDGQQQDDKRESVLIVEEWRVETRTQTVVVFTDEKGGDASLPKGQYEDALAKGQQFKYVRDYTDKTRCVYWAVMSGVEILEEDREYPASGIGIVPVYGYVGWDKGRMTYCGLARRGRSPQRAYNYHVSEIRAYMNQAPKAPWITPERAIRGFEPLWDRASVDSRAYLPYNDMDEAGPIASPSRPNVSINLQNHMQGAIQAKEDIQAAFGMYQANLGAPSNETSGVAIDSRKQQGEASTAHFPAHLAAALGQVGMLCMDMTSRLIDTKRQLRVLGIDMTPGHVTVNPDGQAIEETPQGLSINPNVGKYDVRVVVGASFSTQRQQAQQAYTEMMRANPSMTPALAPLWAQSLDVPHADKLAQVLTAVAPPEVKAILQPQDSNAPTTAELTAKVQQLGQALQAAIQEAHAAQQELDDTHAEAAAAKAAADAKEDEVAIKAYDAQTKRMQVVALTPEQVQQIAMETVQQAMAQPNPAEEPGEAPEAMANQPATPPMQGAQDMEAPEPAEPEGPSEAEQEIMQGQEHVSQLLEVVINLLQAPRKRIPVRDKKTGDILHVIDKIDTPQTLQ